MDFARNACTGGERCSWKHQFHTCVAKLLILASVVHELHELDAFLFPHTPSHMWSVITLCRYTYALALVASSSAAAVPLAQRSGSGPVSPTAGKRRASKRSTTLTLIALPSCLRHWASDTTCLKSSGFMPCNRQRSRALRSRPLLEIQILLRVSKQGHVSNFTEQRPTLVVTGKSHACCKGSHLSRKSFAIVAAHISEAKV